MNKHADHRWFEGVEACTRKSEASDNVVIHHDTVNVILFLLFLCLINIRKTTPARTTRTISSVCSKCGIIAKSGKNSCCGRGGSWFKNCGSAGNAQLAHTWYEGIRACGTRAQFEAASSQQKSMGSSNGTDMLNSRVVMMVVKPLTPTPVNTSISLSTAKSARTFATNDTVTTNITVYISLLIIIVWTDCD